LGHALDLDAWQVLADLEARSTCEVCAFDVSLDRGNAALATAGRTGDGRVAVEVVAYRRGVGWIEDEVRAWRRRNPSGLVVADALAAGTLAERLEAAGVEVLRTGPSQMARACADLVDQVSGAGLCHRGQAVLDDAVAAAGRRILGDGWAWSRRGSDVDISPLVAVTLAAWLARTRPPQPAPFVAVAPR
jgi:hypothetical protein